MTEQQTGHVVLIAGGAVAGSEAAFQLAQKGVTCIVVEQNPRPYGKVEDGLPRWHEKQRLQEEKKIDEKLTSPGVHFVPRTKVGAELTLEELLGYGFSAIVFANGAWRDRSLPVAGIDRFIGKGFYYQNPLVYWFNHYTEASYPGPAIEPLDGALVVGGGLASLDVVKILMLETVVRALAARGKTADLYELEHEGISKGLARFGVTMADLGLNGCTLIYRRQTEDMPVASADDGATQEQLERTRATRRKILQNFVQKYQFRFQNQRVPVGFLAEQDRLVGLRLAETAPQNGRVVTVPGSEYEFASPLVVSSIGSIPEPIPGVQMSGETYRIKDLNTGEVEGLDRVFAIGNAVTGQGNILVSRRHGRVVSEHMLEHYLSGAGTGYEEVFEQAANAAAAAMTAVAKRLSRQPPPTAGQVASIMNLVRKLQERAGYQGGYGEWIANSYN